MSDQPTETQAEPAPAPAHAPSAAATGDLRPGGVSGIRVRPQRERPPRRPLVPMWAAWIAAGVAAALVLLVILVAASGALSSVRAPSVVGEDVALARLDLQRSGLSADIAENRFSTRAKGTVLAQLPSPGTRLRRGAKVALVVSAGTETFPMPDVIGDGLALAQGTLSSKGLVVSVQTQPSTSPSGTVLSSDPLPGANVQTGQTVNLTVSATSTGSGLQQYNLSALNVAIDPEPVSPGQPDVTYDMGQRLESLLRAAGANVFVTRSVTETQASANVRAQRVAESTATALIVLSTAPAGQSGMAVYSPSTGAQVAASKALAGQISSALGTRAFNAPASQIVPDVVLQSARGSAVKVRLGSFSAPADAANFQNGNWADAVAQSLYRAFGVAYGAK